MRSVKASATVRDPPKSFYLRQSEKNLSVDDNGSTYGDEGGYSVEAEGGAKKGPTHLKQE